MRVAVVVPVSPFESAEIIKNSVKRIKNLDFSNFDFKILYVIDLKDERDERVRILLKMGVDVLKRRHSRGKRAGAINDAIAYLEDFSPDYVAIFDVDSEPNRDFLLKLVEALENDPEAYIASSPRRISNPVNLCTETIEVEYLLINYLLRKSGFKQFNGLIGVLRWDILKRYRIDERYVTEDAEFATRMHSIGYKALYVRDSCVKEQAPLTWKDLFFQRKRWYFGGLQLWNYFSKVKRSRWGFRISWIMSLTLTYFIAFFSPIIAFSPILLCAKFGGKKIKVSLGLLFHVLILQSAAFASINDFLKGRGIEWRPQKRLVE
ncbi:glycosyltransferase family 2 protein [Archaeoglobales archaeon]|nr:MAG: glycosyltransferase family 2 protein [Archaeoglobales archaeon]